MNGFPESGFPVLSDVSDRMVLNTLYGNPLKIAGFVIDVVGNNRLAGNLTLGIPVANNTAVISVPATSGIQISTPAGNAIALNSSGSINYTAFAAGPQGHIFNSFVTMGGALSGVTTLSMSGALTGLTSLGSIIARANKGWFKDLDVTNMPFVNGRDLGEIFAYKNDGIFSGGTGVADLSGYTLTLPTSLTLQFRKGTYAELQTITLASGEPGWTTDTKILYVGDGSTVGGNQISSQWVSTGADIAFTTGLVTIGNTTAVTPLAVNGISGTSAIVSVQAGNNASTLLSFMSFQSRAFFGYDGGVGSGVIFIGNITTGTRNTVFKANSVYPLTIVGAGAVADTLYLSAGKVGFGTPSPNQQIEITANFRLPASTSTVGIIYSGADRYIHNVGTNNFFAGAEAGTLTTSGTGLNVGVGKYALRVISTGSYNTAVGYNAGGGLTTTDQNTAFGAGAIAAAGGTGNSAFGVDALSVATGLENVGFGIYAGSGITTGRWNMAIGYAALGTAVTGDGNTGIGRLAGHGVLGGSNNTFIGFQSGYLDGANQVTTGSNNTFIGYKTGLNSSTQRSKSIAFGYNAKVDADNTFAVGGTGADAVDTIFGGVTASAKVHIVKTTEQLRVGYDVSNYLSATISSTGGLTLNLVGTSPEFTFSDAVNVPDEVYGAGWNGNTEVPTKNALYDKIETLGASTRSVGITIDGGGSVITTGGKGQITFTYACTINNWYVVNKTATAGESGSIVIDIKRSGTSIVGGGGNKPTIASSTGANAAVSGWTSTAVSAGDILEFNVDSVTTFTWINLTLKVTT